MIGILVAAFASYQLHVVPAQNEEVEFRHQQTVREDMERVRNVIVSTAQTNGATTTVGINLGTRYPARLVALSPPPPRGRVRTTAAGTITVDGDEGLAVSQLCSQGQTTPITSKSLVYTANYRYMNNFEAFVYENTFQASVFDGGVVREPQRLALEDGGQLTTLNLFVLTGSVATNGFGVASLHIEGGGQNITTIDPDDELTVTLPSYFDAATWEQTLLADTQSLQDVAPASGDRVTLTFDPADTMTVTCAAAEVGMGTPLSPITPGTGADTGGAAINPAGRGELVYRSAAEGNPDSVATITFDNTAGSSLTITDIRVPVYYADTGTDRAADTIDTFASRNFTTDSTDLAVGAPLTPLTSAKTFPSGTTTVSITFDSQTVKTQGDFFILVVKFKSGETATYFITPGK